MKNISFWSTCSNELALLRRWIGQFFMTQCKKCQVMLKFKIMKTNPQKKKIQIVTIAENKLLLLQFAKSHNEGFQNITGSVEGDENFLQAAERELQEEIGIKNSLIDINYGFNFHDRWKNDIEEKVFLCPFKKIPQITLSPEHQTYKWIPVNEVTPSHFVFPTNFVAFNKALEFMTK